MIPCPWCEPHYPDTYEEILIRALRRKGIMPKLLKPWQI